MFLNTFIIDVCPGTSVKAVEPGLSDDVARSAFAASGGPAIDLTSTLDTLEPMPVAYRGRAIGVDGSRARAWIPGAGERG